MSSKNLLPQVVKSLLQKDLLYDACAVVIIGIDDHLKRAEFGLYAVESVLEELPINESTNLFSKVRELMRYTSGFIKVNEWAKRDARKEVIRSYTDLEEITKGDEPEVYALNNGISPRIGLLVRAVEHIASVALYTYDADTQTLIALEAALTYLPEDKRDDMLNKIIKQGLTMLTSEEQTN